jgi:hypothetical protein
MFKMWNMKKCLLGLGAMFAEAELMIVFTHTEVIAESKGVSSLFTGFF